MEIVNLDPENMIKWKDINFPPEKRRGCLIALNSVVLGDSWVKTQEDKAFSMAVNFVLRPFLKHLDNFDWTSISQEMWEQVVDKMINISILFMKLKNCSAESHGNNTNNTSSTN